MARELTLDEKWEDHDNRDWWVPGVNEHFNDQDPRDDRCETCGGYHTTDEDLDEWELWYWDKGRYPDLS